MSARRPRVEKSDYYRGVRTAPYDLIKELTIALGGLFVVILVLSAVLSSPDIPSVTIRSWATADPVDFVTTAASELAGSSTTGTPASPTTPAAARCRPSDRWRRSSGPACTWPSTRRSTSCSSRSRSSAVADQQLTTALGTYDAASSDQQQQWLTAFSTALGNATVADGQVKVAAGDYGPVPVLMERLLGLAQSGALDGLMLISDHFYQTDYSKPLLFMADGGYLAALAQAQKLTGSQWGMMNETGRYPGQAWLWLYTLWYQIPPYSTASNADLLVVLTMVVLSLALLLIPFIPGLRDIPRWIPIHRLIWRRHYRGLT